MTTQQTEQQCIDKATASFQRLNDALSPSFQRLNDVPSPSFQQLKDAADHRGSAVAQYIVGFICHEQPATYKDAVHYFTLAALQGHIKAQNFLGVCYFKGLGVDADEKTARFWCQQAGKQALANEEARKQIETWWKFKSVVKPLILGFNTTKNACMEKIRRAKVTFGINDF